MSFNRISVFIVLTHSTDQINVTTQPTPLIQLQNQNLEKSSLFKLCFYQCEKRKLVKI